MLLSATVTMLLGLRGVQRRDAACDMQEYLRHRTYVPPGGTQPVAMGALRIDGSTSLDDRCCIQKLRERVACCAAGH